MSLDVEFSDRFVDLTAEGYDAAIRTGPLASSSMIAHRIIEMHQYKIGGKINDEKISGGGDLNFVF